MDSNRSLAARGLCALLLLLAGSAGAVTIDFRNHPTNSGGYGNSLSFSSGGIGVSASAYAETGTQSPPASGFYLFQTAQIWSWSTGLGICNRNEGVAGSTCDSSEHEVDTIGAADLLVLVFDQAVSFFNLTVDPYDGPGSDANDRDVYYWVGNVPSLPNLLTETFDTLDNLPGFGAPVHSAASDSYDPFTHALSGTGNVLLLSGVYFNNTCKSSNGYGNSECEAYKIKNINVISAPVIPVPAAVWLFGSALGLLVVVRRKLA
jgi:hypothetical protein